MFGLGERGLVYKYSTKLLEVKTASVTKKEALAFFQEYSLHKDNTDISFACLVNSVQSIVGNDKEYAAIAIGIFENIMESGKAGQATKEIIISVLPTLNVPLYARERLDALKRLLRKREPVINNPDIGRGAQPLYGIVKPDNSPRNDVATKYGISKPRIPSNQVSTKYGVGKCFPSKDNTK